jgi:hypothetical protein
MFLTFQPLVTQMFVMCNLGSVFHSLQMLTFISDNFLCFVSMFVTLCNYGCPMYLKHRKLAVGKYNWFSFLVSNLCTDKLVWKFFWLFTTNIIKNNIYWHDASRMSSFLNELLRQFLAPAPDIIVIILFSNVNTQHIFIEFPQKIILYLWKYAEYTVLTTPSLNKWNNFLIANTQYSISEYFFPSSNDYQFANPKTLYLLFLLWVYLHIR